MADTIKSSSPFSWDNIPKEPEKIFWIPKDYFKTLPIKDFSVRNLQNPANSPLTGPILTGLKDPGQDYFEALPEKIVSRIGQEEHEKDRLASLWDRELKNTKFYVPENYFSTLENSILQKNRDKNIFKLALPTNSHKILQLLAAASLTLLAIFYGIQYQKSYFERASFSMASAEDRLKYRYGIDDSVLEDELVGDAASSPLTSEKSSLNDQYLLSHSDSNTLLEEL